MTQLLQEFVDSRGVQLGVDREAGVLRGVKILGLKSRNGRSYLPEALSAAAALYEGAKVNVNHPKGNPLAPRDYQDRIGLIRNVTFRSGEGLFADFHFNPKHPLSEQLVWDAEHAPENVGFSHNVQARTRRQGDNLFVESISKVQSVDLVADPATTRGLFEQDGAEGAAQKTDADKAASGLLEQLTLEQLREGRPDLVDILRGALRDELLQEHQDLHGELDRLRASQQLQDRRRLALSLLAESDLPNPDVGDGWAKTIVSEAFMQSLLSAPDEAAMRKAVSERAQLVESARRLDSHGGRTRRPTSRDQHLSYSGDSLAGGRKELSTSDFVQAIT